ncbi:MAG: transposase [Opitutaceae bacterium]|nr:transposase [Opitutaceae bacterium]
MRQARIKVPSDEGPGTYHVVTRTVNGERLFDDLAKEILRRQLWQVAEYCGVEIHTYAILSNHFHVLLRVPQQSSVSDAELLRRYRILYPHPTRFQTQRWEVIQALLAANGPEAVAWRLRQRALMNDVSAFMKLLKQRFSIWFNQTHRRYGTLWSERFKSVLLEPEPDLLATVAAYIDLNCVRAGLARDPKDYRFCGYAEAVAGNKRARSGLAAVHSRPARSWSSIQAAYRQRLFGSAASPRVAGATISAEQFARVLREDGRLPLATVLRCKIRYFTDGAVLGSRAYLLSRFAAWRRRNAVAPPAAYPLPPVANWGNWSVLRRLRKQLYDDSGLQP